MSSVSVTTKTRIFIADDHPLVRDWLAQLINREPDLTVCGEAADAGQTLTAIAELKPDMAIVDLTMKDTHGLDLVQSIRTQFKELLVLVFSVRNEELYAERAIRAGARGYIMKQEVGARIKHAIRVVLAGQIYISQKLRRRSPKTLPRPIDILSERQLELLRLIGAGLSIHRIAEQLGLSAKTVEGYIARTKKKLEIPTANELLQYAIQFNKIVGD
ncbi:MAG TPA: response regulator transcription factor [Verrucomicrobiae bacterium]|nr:response regulator transcription factor [Verrucomicrobiae bacterium]